MRRTCDDDEGPDAPVTFDFLGFTLHWGKSLAGKWAVKTRTASDRFRRALKNISECGEEDRLVFAEGVRNWEARGPLRRPCASASSF
jgi:hypothetical protein